jgi:hypothetical protein
MVFVLSPLIIKPYNGEMRNTGFVMSIMNMLVPIRRRKMDNLTFTLCVIIGLIVGVVTNFHTGLYVFVTTLAVLFVVDVFVNE